MTKKIQLIKNKPKKKITINQMKYEKNETKQKETKTNN